jgi:hypothetical protein
VPQCVRKVQSRVLQITCHNLESMMDVYQLLLPHSILTFSSNPVSQKEIAVTANQQ